MPGILRNSGEVLAFLLPGELPGSSPGRGQLDRAAGTQGHAIGGLHKEETALLSAHPASRGEGQRAAMETSLAHFWNVLDTL